MTTTTRTPISNPPSPAPDTDGPPRPRRRYRTWLLVAIVGVMLAVLGVGVWAIWFRPAVREPIVRFDQPIPADVETEARAAVADFADVFEARRECSGTAAVVLVRDVEGGDARYIDGDAVIEIEIPTTPARFRESLVHELAHHVEHRCPAFAELRNTWAEETATDWTGQGRWEDRPSEQWAELVVEMVLGERMLHGEEMPIDPRLVVLAVEWVDG